MRENVRGLGTVDPGAARAELMMGVEWQSKYINAISNWNCNQVHVTVKSIEFIMCQTAH